MFLETCQSLQENSQPPENKVSLLGTFSACSFRYLIMCAFLECMLHAIGAVYYCLKMEREKRKRDKNRRAETDYSYWPGRQSDSLFNSLLQDRLFLLSESEVSRRKGYSISRFLFDI